MLSILQVGGPVSVRDVIEVDGLLGRVDRISATWTVVRTPDNYRVMIPNSALMSSSVTNWSREETHSRIEVGAGVAYGSDVDRVTDLLLEVARSHEKVRANPAPSVHFMQFGSSSLDFRLLAWIDDTLDGPEVRSGLRYAINRVFAENNIEIPFPQRDLHLRTSESAVEIARGRGWEVTAVTPQDGD